MKTIYQHKESARPICLVFIIIGTIGLVTINYLKPSLFPYICGNIIFSICLLGTLPGLLSGGYWYCNIYEHEIEWGYPSKFYGKAEK